MIGVCPRCGTPRQGDVPICGGCGLDFRVIPAPSWCPRCGAPLYPGYTLCGHCGFDSGFAASSAGPGQVPPPWPGQMPSQVPPPWPGQMPAYTPIPATQPPRKDLGGALILLGIALLVAAAGIAFVALPKSSSASHVPEASTAALASPTDSPTPEETSSATVTEEPTLAPRTVEPAPDATWARYTSPDGKWSVLFPGASPKPLKMTKEIGTGAYTGDATVYAVMGLGGVNGYMVMYVDFDASLFKGIDSSTLLPLMAASMAQGLGGTEISAAESTIGAYPAQDETISIKTAVYDLRMSFVGSRFYVLMAMSSPGDEIYPKYFMDSFKLK